MKLFNRGKRTVLHAESHNIGSACEPMKIFTVSDELGKKLKAMYPNELENLDDALDKFEETKAEVKAEVKPEVKVEPKAKSKKAEEKIEATQDEKDEAKSLNVSIEDLRKLKA